jgi:uncharacterized membrane-anchored protein YhcB (DUF1043 family)
VTAVWVGLVCLVCLVCLVVGLVAGVLVKRRRWIELGRKAERQDHGWSSSHYLMPEVPRQRRWSQRNVKREPAPAEPQPLRPGLDY